MIRIKKISQTNYLQFYNKFSKIKDFKVSKKILFYELDEIKHWVNNSKHNIFYGLFDDEQCIGFCYAKIMSNHWALIDNFYVLPKYRNKKNGLKLQQYIEDLLKRKGIKYISRVTKQNNTIMQKFLYKTNYKNVGKYVWFEKFI